MYPTARAYEPTDKVLGLLNLTQRIALGLNSWHLTQGIMSLPRREGGLGHASMAAYTQWVHSLTFVQAVCKPHTFAPGHIRVPTWLAREKQRGRPSGPVGAYLGSPTVSSQIRLVWTPSHMNVLGNDKADQLAEDGTLSHSQGKKRRSEEPPEPKWVALGLQPMPSDVSSSAGSGGARSCEGGETTGSSFETEPGSSSRSVSETTSDTASRDSESGSEGSSDFSTDVSERQHAQKRCCGGDRGCK